jgi:hypothetical protein
MIAAVLLGTYCSAQATETVPPPSIKTPQMLLLINDLTSGNGFLFNKQ